MTKHPSFITLFTLLIKLSEDGLGDCKNNGPRKLYSNVFYWKFLKRPFRNPSSFRFRPELCLPPSYTPKLCPPARPQYCLALLAEFRPLFARARPQFANKQPSLTHQPQCLCCSFRRIQPLLESSVATLLRNWKRAQNRAFECCCRYSPPVLGNYPLPHWLVCKMLSFAKHWILGCKKD